MIKKIIILSIILSFTLSVSTFDILKDTLENEGKIPFQGIEVTMFYNEKNFPEILVSKVIYGGNYRFRREYIAPPFFLGRVTIDDGIRKYEYEPILNRLRISPTNFITDPQDIKRRIELIKKNYNTIDLGYENMLDRKTIIVSLISKYTNKKALQLWIDIEKNYILRKDKYNSEGRLVSRTFYSEIKYENNSLPNHLFKPDPTWKPQKVIDESNLREIGLKESDFSPELPLGYVLDKVYIILKRDDIIFYSRYTDGLNTVSLFKSNVPIAKDKDVKIEDSFLWKTVFWHDQRWSYVLIGDIPSNKLEEFLKKISP